MTKEEKKLGLLEVISMAVGTMVGASIFSIFGLGVQIAGRNLPEAFLLSAVFAIIVAYSYATLGPKIVSDAGPIAFILKAFGDSTVVGAISFLMWLVNVVSIALFALGFTGYFIPLLNLPSNSFVQAVVIVLLISFFTALNFFGSKAVGKLEFYIVVFKLSVLGLFIVLGLFTIKPDFIIPSTAMSGLRGTMKAAVVFFLSYMGFGIVTNVSENMENPQRNVPRAIYISVIFVSILYISVSLSAIGNLPLAQIEAAKDNALAIAAKPFLGDFGFVLISIGALFSIASALNATLYGSANIAYSLAKDGELPEFFERKIWFKSTEGLYITSGLALFFSLVLNLGDVAMITSTIFTLIYLGVIAAHYKMADEFKSNRKLLGLNFVIILVVFFSLLYFQLASQINGFIATVFAILGSLVFEWFLRNSRNRDFTGLETKVAADFEKLKEKLENMVPTSKNK